MEQSKKAPQIAEPKEEQFFNEFIFYGDLFMTLGEIFREAVLLYCVEHNINHRDFILHFRSQYLNKKGRPNNRPQLDEKEKELERYLWKCSEKLEVMKTWPLENYGFFR